MGQVCLGKDSASGSDFRQSAFVCKGNLGQLLHAVKAQSLRLLVQEAPGARGAGGVGLEVQVTALCIKAHEAESFPAHNQDRADVTMNMTAGFHDGDAAVIFPAGPYHGRG